MKITSLRKSAAIILISSVLAVCAAGGTQASAATKQSLQVTAISKHCIDEFDEEDIIYVNEGDKVCKVTVQVKGRGKTKSKVMLQNLGSDGRWEDYGFKVLTTNASGKATFSLDVEFPDQPGDDCYISDSFTFRFAVAQSGKYKAFKSASFEVAFTSSESNPACSDDYDDDDDYDYDDYDDDDDYDY